MHARRTRFVGPEWLYVVNMKVFHSKDAAVETEPELRVLVGEVDARNGLVNGRGLLCPRNPLPTQTVL